MGLLALAGGGFGAYFNKRMCEFGSGILENVIQSHLDFPTPLSPSKTTLTDSTFDMVYGMVTSALTVDEIWSINLCVTDAHVCDFWLGLSTLLRRIWCLFTTREKILKSY